MSRMSIQMMRENNTDRTQWNPLDDAYPWVIGHRLFPMALLAQDGQRGRWVGIIAEDVCADAEVVAKIVEMEATR